MALATAMTAISPMGDLPSQPPRHHPVHRPLEIVLIFYHIYPVESMEHVARCPDQYDMFGRVMERVPQLDMPAPGALLPPCPGVQHHKRIGPLDIQQVMERLFVAFLGLRGLGNPVGAHLRPGGEEQQAHPLGLELQRERRGDIDLTLSPRLPRLSDLAGHHVQVYVHSTVSSLSSYTRALTLSTRFTGSVTSTPRSYRVHPSISAATAFKAACSSSFVIGIISLPRW